MSIKTIKMLFKMYKVIMQDKKYYLSQNVTCIATIPQIRTIASDTPEKLEMKTRAIFKVISECEEKIDKELKKLEHLDK